MNKHFEVQTWSKNKDEKQILKVMDRITEASLEDALVHIKEIVYENCFNNPSSNMHFLFKKITQIK